jgi:hypothetical protein
MNTYERGTIATRAAEVAQAQRNVFFAVNQPRERGKQRRGLETVVEAERYEHAGAY